MKYHPHLHLILQAGGIDKNGKWKNSRQDGNFLFNVKQMSAVFSARFAKKLRRLKQQGKINKQVPRDLIKKPCVVYAKQAFGSPPYFRRIRHLGFLSSRNKKHSLAAIRKSFNEKLMHTTSLSRAQVLELLLGERSLFKCSDCGGELKLLETWRKQRAPPVDVWEGIC